MNDKPISNHGNTEEFRRLKEKSKEIRKKNIAPPIDEDEPVGRLSGGPDSLDLPAPKSDD
ncbi:hypothetical protein R50073_17890 [Maricurvus nonylphenolicus]|uniref:hypothetical protein n=1 Tax=Maricurvus nonylphenolicus TaxID=1008307 RepID=UPI0036F2F6E9